MLGKFHLERWNPARSGEGSSGEVPAMGGRREVVAAKGTEVPGAASAKGITGELRRRRGSASGVGTVGGGGAGEAGVGSGSPCEPGGPITTSGPGVGKHNDLL